MKKGLKNFLYCININAIFIKYRDKGENIGVVIYIY